AYRQSGTQKSTGGGQKCSQLFPVEHEGGGGGGFKATMARSDFSRPCFIGFGSSPSPGGPPYAPRPRPRRPTPTAPPVRDDPFARDVALDPGRATAPRIAVPHMLPSSE